MSLAFKVEEMAREAAVLRSTTLAVYEAIYNGGTGYKEFDDALNAVFCMAHDHMDHMKSLSDEVYELQRKKKAGDLIAEY